jgi:hypothetical protein
MKSFSSMVPTTFEYQQGPLVAPYISSMSHNSGGVIDLEEKYISEFKNTPR